MNTDLVAVATSPLTSRLLTAWEKRTPATTTPGTLLHRRLLVTPARSGRTYSLPPAMHRVPCHSTTTPTSSTKVVLPHPPAS